LRRKREGRGKTLFKCQLKKEEKKKKKFDFSLPPFS